MNSYSVYGIVGTTAGKERNIFLMIPHVMKLILCGVKAEYHQATQPG
jgi:hypothetical protein